MNGDVRLRVEGLMLERLVERAISEGARFRTVVRTGAHTMEMATDSAGERILCELCAKFSMPIQVLERSGGTGARMKMRSRMSALAGAIACIACTLICLSRVWMIDIRAVGDAAIDAGALRARLEDLGVREGMARADVNADALALQMSALSPEYSFIGVRLQGVRLLLEAAGEEAAPETFDISDPRDLIASWSGVVVSVNVRAGEACVQAGDTVAKGQTLIRGVERVSKEEKRRVAALGEVVARTWETGEASCARLERVQTPTGRVRDAVEMRLGNYCWPIEESEPFENEWRSVERLPVGGLFLPLELVKTHAIETRTKAVERDKSALQYALSALAQAEARAKMGSIAPGDGWMESIEAENGELTARAVIEARINIAVPREAFATQGG